jgi:hypothetical protein
MRFDLFPSVSFWRAPKPAPVADRHSGSLAVASGNSARSAQTRTMRGFEWFAAARCRVAAEDSWRCRGRALDVNFQEVVHSAPAGNADVARPQ